MTTATDWANRTTTFTWTPDGQRKRQTTPDGVTSTYDYDTTGRTKSIQLTAAGASLDTYDYTYDDAGQIKTGDGNTYTFDKGGKLAGVAGPTTNGTYNTTPAGSLTGTPDGTTLAYNAAEQLTAATHTGVTQASYANDTNGNRTTATIPAGASSPAGTTSYHYNSPGALTRVTTTSGDIGYTIDGAGLRKSRTSNGATTTFTWATNSSMPLLLDDGTHRYLYGPDLTPYAQIDHSGTVEYLHTDNLGSVRRITNAAGATTSTNTYDPYGKRTAHTGTADSRIGFTGAWTDPDTGLVYLRARDYDPATGQFLTLDPAIDTTGQPYAYARNNPIQNTDPAGLCADCSFMQNWVLNHGATRETLTTGVIGHVVGFLEGVGDGASFGLTGIAREALSPGSSCYVKTNSWAYKAGEALPYVLPAGAAFKGAYGAIKGIRAARAIAGAGVKAGVRDGVEAVGGRVTAKGAEGFCSFTGDTRVLMADGTSKPIAAIKTGDKVQAADPKTGRKGARTVTHLWIHQDQFVKLKLGKASVNTTKNHPFWNDTDKVWEPSAALDPGDLVLTADGQHVRITGLTEGSDLYGRAYNLTVDDIHTYYVLAGTTPVLVHNTCGEWGLSR
ncbi:RHS repeat-associated core domain-containing protein [Krasilnikovia sp. M28-CT-15]|uniref:RHS repeat-associated core domain-containing protein n=1 Tax=Krasilnikovia sp. M28-CT-15 TaxID=3373540 RepID=UPI00387714E6